MQDLAAFSGVARFNARRSRAESTTRMAMSMGCAKAIPSLPPRTFVVLMPRTQPCAPP
jgi:hypothetical protein